MLLPLQIFFKKQKAVCKESPYLIFCMNFEKYFSYILLTHQISLMAPFTSWDFGQYMLVDDLFLWYGWLVKGFKPYFQPGPLSEIFTIANLRHAASSSDLVEWSCAVVITNTPRRHRVVTSKIDQVVTS